MLRMQLSQKSLHTVAAHVRHSKKAEQINLKLWEKGDIF